MSTSLPVLIPGSSVPAAKPECRTCDVTHYALRLEDHWRRSLPAQIEGLGHLNDALRLLADPATLDRGAVRDAVLAAKRSLR